MLEHPLLLHLGGHHARPLHWKSRRLASYARLGRNALLRTCLRHEARLLSHHSRLLGVGRPCTYNLLHWSSSSLNASLSLHLQSLQVLDLLRGSRHLCQSWVRIPTPRLCAPESRCSRAGHPIGGHMPWREGAHGV